MSCTKNINDNIFMQRCLQLAANGEGTTAPNPMVGAVIVHQGEIIGEGWHQKAGMPHAEPNAIHSVKQESLLRESTLYVSLEPCSHYGKTPPCADLIIEKHIPRVVVGCRDPFPKVNGSGLAKLQAAGIQVKVNVEKEACLMLNRKFFRFHISKRPYIILKWAQTADGFTDISRNMGDGKQTLKISDDYTSLIVHKLRSQVDAVMVGARTALLDNPDLTVRYWHRDKQPLRITWDRKSRLSPASALFNGAAPTLVLTGADSLEEILHTLYVKNIQSLLVEGGSKLQNAFIAAGLWDEIQVETSGQIIREGHPSPLICDRMFTECMEFDYQSIDSGHRIRSWIRKISH